MPEGGTLRILSHTIELDWADCRASTFDLRPGPHLELDLRDTGRGIPQGDLGRIFEPFFTTKEPGEGTGLGLATVFGTVQQHRGAINVYSEVGQGTRFQILLPLVDSEAGAEDRDSLDPVSGSGCILMVDDEAAVRTTAEAMLRQLGYDVLVAEDGQAALEIFADRHAEIDAVLLDMVMPRMNGRDCFQAMKKIDPSVRVVLASGFAKDDDVAQLREAGLLGFVEKPYLSARLGRVMLDALESPVNA